MKKIIMSLLVTVLFTFSMFADENVKLKDGREILVKSNNTWEYVKKDVVDNNEIKVKKDSIDCSKYIMTTTDDITGDKLTRSKSEIKFNTDSDSAYIFIFNYINDKYKVKETIIQFHLYRNQYTVCVNDDSEINLLFNTTDNDKARLKIFNTAKYNCKGKVIITLDPEFENSKSNTGLRNMSLKAIRFHTEDSSIDFNIKDEDAILLQNTIQCMYNMLK